MATSTFAIAVVWKTAPKSAAIHFRDGELGSLAVIQGEGRVEKNDVQFKTGAAARLHVDCCHARLNPGSPATVVTLATPEGTFSFFLRDVSAACPLFIPEYGVAVIPDDDARGYEQVAEAVRRKGGLTKLQRINLEPEEDYATAAAGTRRIFGRTTLGLGRDMRLFEINSFGVNQVESVTTIAPKLASRRVMIPGTNSVDLVYKLTVSRGAGCVLRQTRRLEDGVLPILNQRLEDEEIIYDLTLFCSLENQPISSDTVQGTHFLVGDGHSDGHNFTPEQAQAFLMLMAEESSRGAEETWDGLFKDKSLHNHITENNRAHFIEQWQKVVHRKEEPILVCRVKAVNTAEVPRYAWFTAPIPLSGTELKKNRGYDPESGFGLFESEHVFCVARLNGKPFPNAEMAVLLQPGASADAEFLIPHRPIDRSRAERLAGQSVQAHHAACRKYWYGKLAADAQIEVPERRIQEMIRACRLHLDLVMYGREPDGVLTSSCGRSYSTLAPESVAMIQFMDSIGRHDIARRALDFFLEKQNADGMIQNFAGHQSEPGPVLWTFAEHFRYTRDETWLRDRAPRLLKTADYLLAWRARNRREELRGKGYGLIDGQWADMQETFHAFGLNALACRGVLAFSGALAGIMPDEAARLEKEALQWKQDLLEAVMRSMELAPVVPLGDGSWTPSLAPWPESDLPACLDGTKTCDTHGTFLTRDNAMPSALIFHGLLEPDDERAARLLRYVTDTYHVRNVRHSQPYISWHPWIHLRRREVKAFLKSYYNTLASLADRETYTFWEHYYGACPFKTEADGAFLMQTRWMLWLEEGDVLSFLPGIPRAWLEDGQTIRLAKVASYFGPLTLTAESQVGRNRIVAHVECGGNRKPKTVLVRLPHPEGRNAVKAEGGVYDAARETVRVTPFKGKADVVIYF